MLGFRKIWGKENKEEKWNKIKNKINSKINKLFLYIFLNLFHLSIFLYMERLNDFKIYKFITNLNYI